MRETFWTAVKMRKEKKKGERKKGGAVGRYPINYIIIHTLNGAVRLRVRPLMLQVRVQCCFTSTETVRTIRDGEPRTSTSTFTQLLNSDTTASRASLFFFFKYALRPHMETLRFIKDGESGRRGTGGGVDGGGGGRVPMSSSSKRSDPH